jgi:hypothetical protein
MEGMLAYSRSKASATRSSYMAARAALGMVVRKDVNEGKGREGEGR